MSKVTVIIAAYNAADCIGECLSRLAVQTFRDFQTIIVNDGSTDETRQAIEAAAIENMKVIDLPKNVGVAEARNIAASHADSAYLAVLDADDLAEPRRLERQVGFLDENSRVAVVGSFLRLEAPGREPRITTKPATDEEIRKGLSFSLPIANTSLMVRADVFEKVGGYPSGVQLGEDYRFIARVLRDYSGANIAEVLVTKRETPDGLTFGISPWRHFVWGLGNRLYAVRTARLPFWHYGIAIAAGLGILVVRGFGLDREDFKRLNRKRRGKPLP